MDGEEALTAVSDPGLGRRREVALERQPDDVEAAQPEDASGFAAAALVAARPEHFVVEVDAPSRGYLVVMDTLYPGWRASVDGRPAPLRPANWVGRAVPVDAGRHRVEMHFAPFSVRAGLYLSLLALAGIAAWLAAARVSRRPSRAAG